MYLYLQFALYRSWIRMSLADSSEESSGKKCIFA